MAANYINLSLQQNSSTNKTAPKPSLNKKFYYFFKNDLPKDGF